jgi:hypothetical protein
MLHAYVGDEQPLPLGFGNAAGEVVTPMETGVERVAEIPKRSKKWLTGEKTEHGKSEQCQQSDNDLCQRTSNKMPLCSIA